MNSLLLSRITKDYLNEDLDLIPARERYRMGWGGSILSSHLTARPAASLLIALRERFSHLFASVERPPVPLCTGPEQPQPQIPPPATFRPPRYFSRGALETQKRKNPEPISYLLTETNETARARPVPNQSLLLRSLCKGKGILKKNPQGLIYLDVDNRFISMLLPYLKAQELVRPPYFNLFTAPDGAHVPVIPAREASFHFLDGVAETGREFSFEIEGLFSLEPVSWPEVEQVWFFKLRAEALQDLRRRYFIPSLPGGHSFHIAVAVKPRITAAETTQPLPFMRINPAFLAA